MNNNNKNTLENRYMEFVLASQAFAIPLTSVKEVIQRPEVTSIPNMPPYFEGMMNLRGKIIGVFNLRKRLGVASANSKTTGATEPVPAEVIIIVEISGLSIGMIVDEVTRVIHATTDSIKDAPVQSNNSMSRYVKKVIQTKDDIVLSIDVGEMLEISKLKNNLAA